MRHIPKRGQWYRHKPTGDVYRVYGFPYRDSVWALVRVTDHDEDDCATCWAGAFDSIDDIFDGDDDEFEPIDIKKTRLIRVHRRKKT